MTDIIQSATVGSRELDDAVLRVAGCRRRMVELSLISYETWFDHNNIEVIGEPEPTQSLDAIVSLIEARGLYVALIERQDASGNYYVGLQRIGDPPAGAPWRSLHTSMILALCLAFVSAI